MEVRRSPLRWWFPLLVMLDLAALFGRSLWWIGEWPQTSVQAQIPAFYFAPLLAAAAAWAAGRVSRNNLDAHLEVAARPGWQIELTQLSATLTYGLAAYSVGAVVAAAVSMAEAGPGFLWPGYLVLGATLLVTFASAGHLVGRWSRSHFAGPVICGIGGMIIIGWFGAPTALGLFAISGSPFEKVSWPALLVRCAIAMLLVGASGLLTRQTLRASGRTWAGIGSRLKTGSLCALICAGIVGLVIAGPLQVVRDAPEKSLCTTDTPRVCLWPEDRKYLSQAQKMSERIRELPAGMFTVPAAFYERGLHGRRPSYEDFYILDGSMWDPSVTLAGTVMYASRPQGCPVPVGSRVTPEYRLASAEVSMWLAMRIFGGGVPADMHGGPPGVNLHAVAQVITLPRDTQIKWAEQRIETIHHAYCG